MKLSEGLKSTQIHILAPSFNGLESGKHYLCTVIQK